MQFCRPPQVQATVVGLLTAIVAVVLGALTKGTVDVTQAAVLCASSVTTAFIAALSLGQTCIHTQFCRGKENGPHHPAHSWSCVPSGMVMVAVIICSRKVGINPDNVATPIAASLGDLITLSLLARVSNFLFCYKGQGSDIILNPLILCISVLYVGECFATRGQQRPS